MQSPARLCLDLMKYTQRVEAFCSPAVQTQYSEFTVAQLRHISLDNVMDNKNAPIRHVRIY